MHERSKNMQKKTSGSFAVRSRYSKRKEKKLCQRDRVLLVQLAVCLALFVAAFLGKGIFPDKLIQVREHLSDMISADFNFKEALSSLGGAAADRADLLDELGEFCIQVFGIGETNEAEKTGCIQPIQPDAVLASELRFLSTAPDIQARTEHYAELQKLGIKLSAPQVSVPEELQDQESETETTVLPAGAVVQIANYDGPQLPGKYTMDKLSLGGLETMTPLKGHMNSGYGYRIHPVSGKPEDFHGGVDIGGQTGEPILAFADGTVEYTGQDDSYGLYLQLDHGNGVKSFYAHCSKIKVIKGQVVQMGEPIALVGSTGTATGPHLHLELKYDRMHVNPAYYVEFLNDE